MNSRFSVWALFNITGRLPQYLPSISLSARAISKGCNNDAKPYPFGFPSRSRTILAYENKTIKIKNRTQIIITIFIRTKEEEHKGEEKSSNMYPREHNVLLQKMDNG